MKLLFLDIDGVCNSRRYAIERAKGGMLGIDPEAAKLVRKIIEQTGCKVVLSSFWRLHADLRLQVQREVCDFIDVTPHYPAGFRGEEVRTWIIDNVPRNKLKAYAILDDDGDFYPFQPLFQTSFDDGLLPAMADQVIRHLNKI